MTDFQKKRVAKLKEQIVTLKEKHNDKVKKLEEEIEHLNYMKGVAIKMIADSKERGDRFRDEAFVMRQDKARFLNVSIGSLPR